MKAFLRKLVALGVAVCALSTVSPAGAEGPVSPLQRLLRGPWFPAASSLLRVTPPRGGHVMLHREGKVSRWFLQPAIIRVEPGVTYGVTAIRDGSVLSDSGLVARPGMLDVNWASLDGAPIVAFHPPAAANPFAVGLVPVGAAPVAALRTPISDGGFQLMLDDIQRQPDDANRWAAMQRYTDTWLFSDSQVHHVVASFVFPMYRYSARQLLDRRRVTTE